MALAQSIFISYRRSDTTGHTGRMYDRLVDKFGRKHVFKDVDDILPGVDFAKRLAKELGQCQVLLVVIGKTWTTVMDDDGNRRLDNPDDFVRLEIEAALTRKIPVVPVLMEGVKMPTQAQLPKSLHPLVQKNGVQVGDDPRFHTDMDRLIKGLEALTKIGPHPTVLILDDDKLWLSRHKKQLNEAGFKTYATERSKDAIKTLKTDPSIKFALIDEILYVPPLPPNEEDRELQSTQGLGVVREINEQDLDVRVIIVTSAPYSRGDGTRLFRRETAALRRHAGVIDVIHKIDISENPEESYHWLIDLLRRQT
ncbi:MAG: TIR domain-containing protein [Cyanobacteria bacterium J06597_16]